MDSKIPATLDSSDDHDSLTPEAGLILPSRSTRTDLPENEDREYHDLLHAVEVSIKEFSKCEITSCY